MYTKIFTDRANVQYTNYVQISVSVMVTSS